VDIDAEGLPTLNDDNFSKVKEKEIKQLRGLIKAERGHGQYQKHGICVFCTALLIGMSIIRRKCQNIERRSDSKCVQNLE
jgi:hypothetical protein